MSRRAHGDPSQEFLNDQSRDFRDTDGAAWRVRIKQGGGSQATSGDEAPRPILLFHAVDADRTVELPIVTEESAWDLTSYSDGRLQSLLAEAQAHARQPDTE